MKFSSNDCIFQRNLKATQAHRGSYAHLSRAFQELANVNQK